MITLRPYQEEAIAAWDAQRRLRDQKRIMLVMATGLGKTVTFWTLMMRHYDLEHKRVLFLAHTQDLIWQTRKALLRQYPEIRKKTYTPYNRPAVGVCMNSYDEPHARVVVATMQTMSAAGRLDRVLSDGPIDLLIIDEAHHAVAPGYRDIYLRLREANPNMDLLGVTATPVRTDQIGLKAMFDVIAFTYDIRRGVAEGWLKPLRAVTVATNLRLANVQLTASTGDFNQTQLVNALEVQNWQEIVADAYIDKAEGRQAIAFLPSVQMSDSFAAYLRDQGIPAAHIDAENVYDEHGKTAEDYGWTYNRMRAEVLNRYKEKKVRVLCNFNILTEGFDAPATSCIIWARPTKSNVVFTQGVGRGTRLPMGLTRMLLDRESDTYKIQMPDGTWDSVPVKEFPEDPDCMVLDFAAEDVSLVQMGTLFGKDISEPADAEQLEAADEEIELEGILPGIDTAALAGNDNTTLYDVGTGQRYTVRSLFGKRQEAWHVDQDATQSVGAGPNNILFISPPRFLLAEKAERQIMRGRKYLDSLPLDDPKRGEVERALMALEDRRQFLMSYTLWNVVGETREGSNGKSWILWKHAECVGDFDNPEDAANAAFPLVVEFSDGSEALNNKTRTWRKAPPSQAQLDMLYKSNSTLQRLLKRAGIRVNIPQPENKGDASKMISHYIALALVVEGMKKMLQQQNIQEEVA